jgi:hypothetical protein
MNREGFPKKEMNIKTLFAFPDIEKESGEIERVAEKYAQQNPEEFMRTFYEKVQEATLVKLTEEMWSVLDNTDSFGIPYDGWEQVAEHVEHTNHETGSSRDWEELRQKMEDGQELDAPIVLKYHDELHLVSGNTRLMVARALGKSAHIVLVEM